MDGILECGAGRKAERIVALGIAAGAVVGLIVVAGIQIATVPRVAADKAYWTVSGPPCPVTTPAAQGRMARPLSQVVVFGQGRFARVSGAVLCTDLTDGVLGLVTGTACQFNGPRALAVWSEGGAAFFDMPGGQPATVTVSRTHPPRCVLAAHYQGD
jgi:hypothetical protein